LKDIWESARDGDHRSVVTFIKTGGKVNIRDSHGMTPLHFAARAGRTDISKMLLRAKAEINAADNWGRTPLHLGALAGKPNVVKVLLTEGAQIDRCDFKGRTALDIARENKFGEISELLIPGADAMRNTSGSGFAPERVGKRGGRDGKVMTDKNPTRQR
jgi:uncharacterized protein